MSVALVLVSHSPKVADGLVDIASQMAPDVDIRPAGGIGEEIGTDFDLVNAQVSSALETADGVVILTDLGSATLTAESVVEMLDDDRVRLVDVPFLEGAVAAAVSAQGGGDVDAVIAAAQTAIAAFAPISQGAADGAGVDASGAVRRTLTLANSLGLHARPAAVVARKAAEFDAQVRINGVDAASVLALMALGLAGGAQIELVATGPDAEAAVDAIGADIEAGFGES